MFRSTCLVTQALLRLANVKFRSGQTEFINPLSSQHAPYICLNTLKCFFFLNPIQFFEHLSVVAPVIFSLS